MAVAHNRRSREPQIFPEPVSVIPVGQDTHSLHTVMICDYSNPTWESLVAGNRA